VKVLLDTNIVLDVMLAREPFLLDSKAVWQACDDGRINGYILASALTDIFYIARKVAGRDSARQAVEVCLAAFAVCPVNQTVLEQALQLPGSDFEDNVQIAAAVQSAMDAIVTRNPDDFAHAPLVVISPAALVTQMGTGTEEDTEMVEEG
jgi:predicted nucleic acid-binding protein